MRMTRFLYAGVVAVGAALVAIGAPVMSARQQTAEAVRLDADDLGGTVTGANGPEAGAWVIAETNDLATKFAKIVVTDDRGRYVIPDLPKATYDVWVRGYGLVDSQKLKATPGKPLNLKAFAAASARGAAGYYPAGYWFSLIKVREKKDFPGGNGINPNLKSQGDWVQRLKSGGCSACHQLGTKGTREIPKELGTFHSSAEA